MKDFLTLMHEAHKTPDGCVDFDVAEFYLGHVLGLWPEDAEGLKGLFWSNNKVGNALAHMLEEMVRAGILAKPPDDGPEFRVANYPWKESRND